MASQTIRLGDCLDVLTDQRNVPAIVADPPANIAFMGRSWDRAHPVNDYVLPCVPRSKAHERELRSEESFIRYWTTRYAMAYDIADAHATAIIWTLPRTSYQTATALRRAGWDIKDNLVHLFGTGWAKTGNALAPGQEGWLLATKGKPDLDIDACRVPRGGDTSNDRKSKGDARSGQTTTYGEAVGERGEWQAARGSLPKNALLSHCEECVRVGVKRVKASTGTMPGNFLGIMNDDGWKPKKVPIVRHGLDEDGTESVPAWHCLAGCVCGARSKWDPEKPLPRCPCGETWRWICAVAEVNEQSGTLTSGSRREGVRKGLGYGGANGDGGPAIVGDQGGASRFFNTFSYLSKCSSSERHAGCENLFWRANKKNQFGFDLVTREEWEALPNDQRAQGNVHPTVKSNRLMHWLHSLTGAKKIVDLCAGSGTGMFTAAIDGIEWIGAEVCPEAVTIAKARHFYWTHLSLSALHSMLTQGDTSKAISLHDKYCNDMAAE